MIKTLDITDIFRQSWDAFSERERLRLIRTLQVIRQNENGSALRGYLIKGVVRKCAVSRKVAKSLSSEQIVDVFHDLHFLHEPWYDFLIPEVNLPLTGVAGLLYPPKSKLSNISFYQFKWIDAKFTKFLVHAHNQETDLAKIELGKFLASIYTPVGPPLKGVAEGRGVFHEDMLSNHGPALYKKFAFWERELTMETYANIRNFIMERYPFLFPSPPSREEPGGDVPPPFYTGHMWQEMHYDLADTEAFQGYIAAGDANIYDALGYLNKKAEEQLKSKRND
jgi:hypothetical protein